MNNPFILLVNNENKDKSSEKYPPKLPVINKTIIGKDYPQPIVIHEKARASALQAFQSLKKN